MKKIIVLLLAIVLMQSCREHTLAEFKQYHPDAPNLMANRIDNFKGICKVLYGQHDDGKVLIFMKYVALNDTMYTAFAQFNHNGKIEFFNNGQ